MTDIIEEIETQTEVEQETDSEKEKNYKLVVYNDDYNTFDKVIIALMTHCSLSLEDAHHCTFKIHNDGSCVVMRDSKSVLEKACQNINDQGIDANVELDEKK